MDNRFTAQFFGNKILLTGDNNAKRLPTTDEAPLPHENEKYDFSISGIECTACALDSPETLPYGCSLSELRENFPLMPATHYEAAVKAKELIHWDQSTLYCPTCGTKLKRHSAISKLCPECKRELFPQISPAIIVLIRKGNKALLVHARTFKRPFFGLVAGFLETGENLEQCVRREVKEETSLEITNIHYVGSQSWPYPAQIMLGFTADYASGELNFADNELTDGGFFDIDTLPTLPTPPSIARKLIDKWISEIKTEQTATNPRI